MWRLALGNLPTSECVMDPSDETVNRSAKGKELLILFVQCAGNDGEKVYWTKFR